MKEYAMNPVVDHVQLINCTSVVPRPVEWVWDEYLPKHKLTLLVGAPKTGKTLVATHVAAIVTSGGLFPDGTKAEQSPVIFWTGEDDLDDTIKPRFVAAGGKESNLYFVGNTVSTHQHQPFNPSVDMPLLIQAIEQMPKKPALLIIDPIVSVSKDMNNALEVRMSLAPVIEMAQRYGMAVLGITHFRKSVGEAGNLGERIIGSSAFLQVARMIWYAIKPPNAEGERVFFKGDTNLSEAEEGFRYEIESKEVVFQDCQLIIKTAGIIWGEKLQGDDLQAFIKPEKTNDLTSVKAEAEAFLKRYLATGARLKADIDEEADNLGLSDKALRRAKNALGICHRKRHGDAKTEWFFPQQLDQGTHTEKVVQLVQVVHPELENQIEEFEL